MEILGQVSVEITTVEPTRRTHHAFDVYPETFD
jgi:hypothetical protein